MLLSAAKSAPALQVSPRERFFRSLCQFAWRNIAFYVLSVGLPVFFALLNERQPWWGSLFMLISSFLCSVLHGVAKDGCKQQHKSEWKTH